MTRLVSLICGIAAVCICSVASAQLVTGSFGAGAGASIVFTADAITSPLYLDMTTNGSTNPDLTGADTELGLFFGTGPGATFVATDDDDGISLTSTLSFGAGSGLLLGDAFNLGGNGLAEGEDGNLAGGTYTLVIGEFNTVFGATLGATTFGNEAVDYRLEFFTNDPSFAIVPEPTALSLLGLASFGLVLRRRR